MNKLKTTLLTLMSTIAVTTATAQIEPSQPTYTEQATDSILAFKDFDGDGKADYLMQRTIDKAYIRLYLQDPEHSALSYNPKKIVTPNDILAGNETIVFKVIDIGYDGDLDIFATHKFDGYRNLNFSFINDGQGNFELKNKAFVNIK